MTALVDCFATQTEQFRNDPSSSKICKLAVDIKSKSFELNTVGDDGGGGGGGGGTPLVGGGVGVVAFFGGVGKCWWISAPKKLLLSFYFH